MRAETLDSQCSARVFDIVQNIAALPDVRAAVEANHDNNRWWPISIVDPRTRMLVAGWSTRISYSMIEIYARVVAKTDARDRARQVGQRHDDRHDHPIIAKPQVSCQHA